MPELIPFGIIDEDDSQWSEDQVEAANFLNKMDWEGGIDGLIGYGGWRIFPEPLQEIARDYERIHDELRNAVNSWAATRGVEY